MPEFSGEKFYGFSMHNDPILSSTNRNNFEYRYAYTDKLEKPVKPPQKKEEKAKTKVLKSVKKKLSNENARPALQKYNLEDVETRITHENMQKVRTLSQSEVEKLIQSVKRSNYTVDAYKQNKALHSNNESETFSKDRRSSDSDATLMPEDHCHTLVSGHKITKELLEQTISKDIAEIYKYNIIYADDINADDTLALERHFNAINEMNFEQETMIGGRAFPNFVKEEQYRDPLPQSFSNLITNKQIERKTSKKLPVSLKPSKTDQPKETYSMSRKSSKNAMKKLQILATKAAEQNISKADFNMCNESNVTLMNEKNESKHKFGEVEVKTASARTNFPDDKLELKWLNPINHFPASNESQTQKICESAADEKRSPTELKATCLTNSQEFKDLWPLLAESHQSSTYTTCYEDLSDYSDASNGKPSKQVADKEEQNYADIKERKSLQQVQLVSNDNKQKNCEHKTSAAVISSEQQKYFAEITTSWQTIQQQQAEFVKLGSEAEEEEELLQMEMADIEEDDKDDEMQEHNHKYEKEQNDYNYKKKWTEETSSSYDKSKKMPPFYRKKKPTQKPVKELNAESLEMNSKITKVQEQIDITLRKIKSSVLNMDNNTSKFNEQNSIESSIRFIRNYIHPIRAMIIDASLKPNKEFRNDSSNRALRCLFSLYTLIDQALLHYRKQMPYTSLQKHPANLIALVEYFYAINDIGLRKGMFWEHEVLVDIQERCLGLLNIIEKLYKKSQKDSMPKMEPASTGNKTRKPIKKRMY